ncbi:MAG: hypothetical protein WCK89_17940 [bacterium]
MPCPVLAPLRGDFLCMPFGGNGTPYHGESHPPHGEVSGSDWTGVDVIKKGAVTTLTIMLETHARPGNVTRQFSLADGHPALYLRSVIEGFTGKTSFGHHAILSVPDTERSLLISTSPFKFGHTCPHPFSRPESGEYQALAQGQDFSSLAEVPTMFKQTPLTDCSSFPARKGYADLLSLFEDPAGACNQPSWSVVVNTEENWLWFCLKDPRVMPVRAMWMENHGRHGHPWNGRNGCLGIEDGCMYFDAGLAESCADNAISRRGIPTCCEVQAGTPFAINTIQGAIRVPQGFGRVADIDFGKDLLTFIAENGQRVTATVRHAFVYDGQV